MNTTAKKIFDIISISDAILVNGQYARIPRIFNITSDEDDSIMEFDSSDDESTNTTFSFTQTEFNLATVRNGTIAIEDIEGRIFTIEALFSKSF